MSRPSATYRAHVLHRLHSLPHLKQKVLDGELSPTAAMQEAGFRAKTFTVPLEPDAAAKRIKRHFTDEAIEKLISGLRER